MCGIAGFAGTLARSRTDASVAVLAAMTTALEHRGPDGSGVWWSQDAPVALGHRRLAIIDLSPGGYQPKATDDGRRALTYNGELYNYRDLREELRATGWTFQTSSDTEVLLAGSVVWGLPAMLRRAKGMFALAYWDGSANALWLARDRFGEKPLYWSLSGGTVSFGSELKALRQVPGFDAEIDRSALASYFQFGAVPSPACIYRGARMVAPGTIVRIDLARGEASANDVSETRYWEPLEEAMNAKRRPFTGTLAEATDAVEEVLGRSVAMQMMSDVPLGAFLSGGIDSSTIASLMVRAESGPVRTFTIGFDDQAFNEADDARLVAKHLGVEHTEFEVTAADALAIVPRLADMFDEPFADSSQIPTHIVSAMARRHVTVALSGDGGDELFGGYSRYTLAAEFWRRVGWVPPSVRQRMVRPFMAISPERWDSLARPLRKMTPLGKMRGSVGDRVHKGARMASEPDARSLYAALVAFWPSGIVLGEQPVLTELPGSSGFSFTEQMMFGDTVGYLPNDILAKVDRAAMATSLETRVPMLDPDVFRLAWSLPIHYRIVGTRGKVVLRELLARHVPQDLWDRPKTGFGVPLDAWLRGPLAGWADDLLDPGAMRAQGYLDVELVQRTWAEHRSGVRNWQHRLWAVLMFQAWLARWSTHSPALAGGRA